jgi:dual specificity tyrosine-phosphorylation-regulated kinase 2/3/4
MPPAGSALHDESPQVSEPSQENPPSTSPPSAFSQSSRRAKKRTSDEFEMDQFGTLVSKHIGSSHSIKGKEDKASSRKHRSLNVGSTSGSAVSRDTKGKERRRESAGLTINSSMKPSSAPTKTPDKHVRQTSASSSSSNHADNHHQRRVHNTDFSHLPPSPSSSSIQQFLRHTASSGSSQTPPLSSTSKDAIHSSPNVAHSLLRGTQEGWSGLDDEATAEALRKLDGLGSKSARVRTSVASFGRPSSSSRPGTPAGKTGGQWEGIGTNELNKSKRVSHIQSSTSAMKDREREQRYATGLGSAVADATPEGVELGGNTFSSDEQSSGVPIDKTPKKTGSSSARSSFTPKRGSTSSTTYTSTPSSRDSASMSTTTSMTSVSAASGRHSTGRARRNSAGSDISNSSDATSLKDRVASLAISGDAPEDGFVPPVPPLPKDLSNYRSPPATSVSLTFPSMPASSEEKGKRPSYDSDLDRTQSLEVPSFTSPPPAASSPLSQGHRLSQHYSSGYTSMSSAPESTPAVLKTPSKKWSFSSALNLKLSSSPSSSSQKSGGFPLSPRAVTFGQQLRKSSSKDQGIPVSSGSSKSPWEPKQPDAMLSAGSLTSLSSVGSVRTPGLTSVPSRTPDRGAVPSRSGTGSSASTSHTTSQLTAPQPGPLSPTASVRRGQSKRLTPSSIPFFRRSSSQSMQLPPSNTFATSSSPTLSSGNFSSTHARQKQSGSPPRDHHNPPSTSVPGSAHKKSSVLSLGLPSLLKSSSRRSLHAESKEAAREIQRAKDAAKDAEKERGKLEKLEKEKQKKEDKDRSESRISVLMGGRKRGKVNHELDSIFLVANSPIRHYLPPILENRSRR